MTGGGVRVTPLRRSATLTSYPNCEMSPLPMAAACLSSNHEPWSLFSPTPFALACSSTPRNATFITWPLLLIAAAAWTRQCVPGGSGIEPLIVLVAGSPRSKKAIWSQPLLETSSAPHLPPPVAGLASLSMATASTVESGA